MSWANEICGRDAEERALVLGIMNASGYAYVYFFRPRITILIHVINSIHAWLPLLTYPATDAPRFKKGFIYSSFAFLAQFAITAIVWFLQRRENRSIEKEVAVASDSESQQRMII
jgi:ACS family pantothenate transporter-like MFS transporter